MSGYDEERTPAPGEVPPGRAETPADGGPADVQSAAARLADLEDKWLRAVADLDNMRKRVARDAERVRAEERARAVREWLPVVDNLDLALRHAGADPGNLIEGVRTVRDQAVALLERLGYPRNDEAGVPFDPGLHEAVGTVPAQGTAPGTVAEVVRPGYGEGDRQLRPATVLVATAPE
ncbi:nucleotide exchange factor GrpE [Sphaerisporangium sp. B11E5]|uniref:nucleotide exchange factor GrpE n=1 Tax=Sphaerisporangium sp. B11E5 TaxID=3153563 RepID=UPI00325D24BE